MNLDGSGLTRLTHLPGTDEFPFCSPDGKMIALGSERPDGTTDIYLMNTDGSGLRNWTNNPADDLHPCWSRDSTRIAFMSNRDGKYHIYVGHVSGPGLIQVTRGPADDEFPSWYSNVIAFASNKYGDWEICITNDDGSTDPVRLTNHRGVDEFPFWSPDGRWLIYHSEIAGKTDLCVMRPDGGEWRNLTHSPASDQSSSWSPDGRWIAFMSDRDGNWNICKVRPDGSELTRLTENPEDDVYPSWFRDGQGLVFQRKGRRTGNSSLWTMNAEGGEEHRLTDDTADNGFVSWLLSPAETDSGTGAVSPRASGYETHDEDNPPGRPSTGAMVDHRGACGCRCSL